MSWEDDYAANVIAYRMLKPTIETDYAPGRFVAIVAGRVFADAATFDELEDRVRPLGLHPMSVLVEQVGRVEPPVGTFPGVFTVTAMGKACQNSVPPTEAR